MVNLQKIKTKKVSPVRAIWAAAWYRAHSQFHVGEVISKSAFHRSKFLFQTFYNVIFRSHAILRFLAGAFPGVADHWWVSQVYMMVNNKLFVIKRKASVIKKAHISF